MGALRLLLGLCLLASGAVAQESLRVLCTLPDLKDIVTQVGGSGLRVDSVARGTENLHRLKLKPSHVVAASKADVFVQMGLSLEHAWVPGLLQTARNKKLRAGQPGFVNVARGWEAIDVPESLSRRDRADVHPEGNPHFNLDPRAGRHVAKVVADALSKVQPAQAESIAANLERYLQKLEPKEAAWRRLAPELEGRKVVTYHSEFDYLLRSLGVEVVGTIEPKPGISPTPKHMASLVDLMREQEVKLILVAANLGQRQAERLGELTGARVESMPTMVGGKPGIDSWIRLQDELHLRLASAFGASWSPSTAVPSR